MLFDAADHGETGGELFELAKWHNEEDPDHLLTIYTLLRFYCAKQVVPSIYWPRDPDIARCHQIGINPNSLPTIREYAEAVGHLWFFEKDFLVIAGGSAGQEAWVNQRGGRPPGKKKPKA